MRGWIGFLLLTALAIAWSLMDLEKKVEALEQVVGEYKVQVAARQYLLDNIFLRPVGGKEVLSIPVTVVTAPMQTRKGQTIRLTAEVMERTGILPGDLVVLKGYGLFLVDDRLWLDGNKVQILQSGGLSDPRKSELIWIGR